MMALFLTVLAASLVGSLHCAGMCGAFVAFAIGAAEPGVTLSRGKLLALYHVGRLATYMTLGAVAGALGHGINLGGEMVGLQRAAEVLTGMMMVGFGGFTLLRLSGITQKKALPVPTVWTAAVANMQRRVMGLALPLRAAATGLLTTLIPCGWLYAFVMTAAGTGHAWSGAALMMVFWVGTLPALTVVGVGVRSLSGILARRLPALSAIAIVAVGLYTIAARAGVFLHTLACCATAAGGGQ